jgi:suppressor for copper-sensitivity B
MNMRAWFIVARFVVVLAWFAPTFAHAGEAGASAWAATAHGGVRLISAVEGVGYLETVALGLQFRMNPGWHVYWRSPGDAGYPPRADWSGSENLDAAELSWPAPHRFSVLDLETIGYSDQVVLPIEARLKQPGEPLSLQATVDYLTCADICVPYVAQLALRMGAGAALPSAFAHEIARARAQVPDAAATRGLAVEQVSLQVEGEQPRLVVHVTATTPLQTPDVFLEAPTPLAFSAPRLTIAEDGLRGALLVDVGNADGRQDGLLGAPVTVTVVDGDRSVERTTTIAAAGPSPAATPDEGPPLPLVIA